MRVVTIHSIVQELALGDYLLLSRCVLATTVLATVLPAALRFLVVHDYV